MPLSIRRRPHESVKIGDIVLTIDIILRDRVSFYIFKSDGDYKHNIVKYGKDFPLDDKNKILFRYGPGLQVQVVCFVDKETIIGRA